MALRSVGSHVRLLDPRVGRPSLRSWWFGAHCSREPQSLDARTSVGNTTTRTTADAVADFLGRDAVDPAFRSGRPIAEAAGQLGVSHGPAARPISADRHATPLPSP
jgi:hypothetical protein